MSDKVSDLHLTYVDPKSKRGLAVDKSLLAKLSKDENKEVLTMDVLTADNIQTHRLGILVCSDDDDSKPALGYVACKVVLSPPSINGKWPSKESAGSFAYIGGLLLHPSIRGHGIAVELVERVTERTFATMPEVDACIVSCNPAGLGVFEKVGYVLMDPDQKVFNPAPGFKAVILTREQFEHMSTH